MTRVPAGTYRRAAVTLTLEHGELDKYTLAELAGDVAGGYVDSRRASAWIRREYGWVKTSTGARSGILKRIAVARPGPIAAGGCPASYVVTPAHLPGVGRWEDGP